MPPLTNSDVTSYMLLVERLNKPDGEVDAIIFQHFLYPKWFRATTLSNMLVDDEKLKATRFMSGRTKIIPSLTKSFDDVFKTFSEVILKSNRFLLNKEKAGTYTCLLMLQDDGALTNSKRYGFNPACALLSAVINTYRTKD